MQLERQMVVIDQKFRLMEEIRQSNNSTVWQAQSLEPEHSGERFYAIKHVDTQGMSTDQMARVLQRLERTAELGEALRAEKVTAECEHIVKVYSFHLWEGDLFLVMEFVDGKSLDEIIGDRSLDKTETLALTSQLCEAVGRLHAHPMGILHRDIKPSNIVVGGKGNKKRLVLVDLGSAVRSDATLETTADEGTPEYLAGPLGGKRFVKEPSDEVQLIARTVIEMLTGKKLGQEERVGKTIAQILRQVPDSQLQRVLTKALTNGGYLTPGDFYTALTKPPFASLIRQRTLGRISVKVSDDMPHDVKILRATGTEGSIRIPKGEFTYGLEEDQYGDPLGEYNHSPSEQIPIKEFWIDQTPVTNQQYQRFLQENKSVAVPHSKHSLAQSYNWDIQERKYPKGMGDHPVVLVSFEEASVYAKWARKSLPTEQQWEKAARGEKGYIYPWGNTWNSELCNSLEYLLNQGVESFEDWETQKNYIVMMLEEVAKSVDIDKKRKSIVISNRDRLRRLLKESFSKYEYELENVESLLDVFVKVVATPLTTPVTKFDKGSSPYGVLDMAGNIWEWTTSRYGARQVLRGGSWLEARIGVRTTTRIIQDPKTRSPWIGFRCVNNVE